mmetsp:Transcript_107817/g.220073  ORF Transcript_107817/g.220073 Transcript_107817/m.220073 type:complete len:184 (-) Transcript_107817:728-1279(-)
MGAMVGKADCWPNQAGWQTGGAGLSPSELLLTGAFIALQAEDDAANSATMSLRVRREELVLPTPFLFSGCMNLQLSPIRHQPLDFQWWHTMVQRLASLRSTACCGPDLDASATAVSDGVGVGVAVGVGELHFALSRSDELGKDGTEKHPFPEPSEDESEAPPDGAALGVLCPVGLLTALAKLM